MREPHEWVEGHIPGSTLIPLGELPARVAEVPKDKQILVVCRSGNRSGMALSILKQSIQADLYNGGGLYDVKLFLN